MEKKERDSTEIEKTFENFAGSLSSGQGLGKKIFPKLDKTAIQSFLGIDKSTAEGMYEQAYGHYTNGRYNDAIDIFQLLMVYNAEDPRFVMGLAACCHQLKEFDSAIQMYSTCGILDPEDPIPHYHLSDCYLQLNDKMSAVVALQMAVKRAGDKEEFAVMKDRALMAIKTYKEELMRPKEF